MAVSVDVIAVAEELIDEVIERLARGHDSRITVDRVFVYVASYCTAHGTPDWFEKHFAERGWRVLIGTRLVELGYKADSRGVWGK